MMQLITKTLPSYPLKMCYFLTSQCYHISSIACRNQGGEMEWIRDLTNKMIKNGFLGNLFKNKNPCNKKA